MTDAGEEFYRYAVLMLREAELAETAIRHRLNEPKGTVRCTAYAVRNARYRARLSPPLSEGPCRCHATDQNVDIVGENYDVAIAAPPENKSTMTACQTLAQSPSATVASEIVHHNDIAHLRSKRTMRRPRRAGDKRGQIVDLVSISKRPATGEHRAVPGYWEGDLLSGSKNSYIATLVERQTRYVTLAKVANKDTQTVVSALIKQAKTIPNELYKSLTWDRGKELADHRRLTLATNIDVYFCDLQSPWQRGSNENTNGLLRQYLPKGTDLSVYSQAQLNKVARQLNERPRKTLGFATPAERFNACVASTT